MTMETKQISHRIDYRPVGGTWQHGPACHNLSSAESERDDKLKLGWAGDFRIMAIETTIIVRETEVAA